MKRRLKIVFFALLLFNFNPIDLTSFHPEMALFRNLGVNLRDRLCDVPTYVSAQSLELLDLAKNCSFLNWKLTPVPSVVRFISGWALTNPVNLSAWAQPSKNYASTRSAETPGNYVIGMGDVLEVFVWRNEQLSRNVVVRPDGKISLPLIQDVQAEGRTVVRLKEEVTRRFDKHLNQPKVTIIVSEVNSYKVSVLGRVVRPGVYPITGNTTLIEAISAAGGFTEWANKRKITVITHREGKEKKITVNYKKIASGKDPGQNIILKRGDTVIVP